MMPENVSLTSNASIDIDNVGQPVVAKIPQGYETRINIQLLAGRDFDPGKLQVGCRPRKGASRREADPVPLPPEVAEKLRTANERVLAWLNADPANAQLFLGKPVEALTKAGVELSRAEQKLIHRAHSENAQVSVIGPGVKVQELKTFARPAGRIGGPRIGQPTKGGVDVGGFTRKGKEE
jgi:hypothetical protein